MGIGKLIKDLMSSLGDAAQRSRINGLIWKLKNPFSFDDQRNAVEALVKIGKPAVESLIRLLGDKDKHVSADGCAIEALGKIGKPAVESLIQALGNEDVKESAAIALGKIGEACAVEPLMKALEGDTTLLSAAVALGKIGDVRAVELLIGTLQSSKYDKLFDKEMVEMLDKINPDWPKSEAARRKLPEFISWLSTNEKVELGYEVLARIGNDAVWPLIDALSRYDKPENGDERKIHALARICRTYIEPLIATLKDEKRKSHVRVIVLQLLADIGDVRAVDALINALGDKEYKVRANAVVALGEIGDTRAVEPLIKELGADS